MIYDFKHKTGILTPPKCGTTILHDVLCKFPTYWYVLGAASWDTTTKHCGAHVINTSEIQIERWVLLIRHPVDRMISMWKHRRTYDGYEGDLTKFVITQNLHLGWYAPCASYGDDIDGVIRQEYMYEDCQKIIYRDLPELQSRSMNKSKFEYQPTEEELEILNETAQTVYSDDLRLGKYEIYARSAE